MLSRKFLALSLFAHGALFFIAAASGFADVSKPRTTIAQVHFKKSKEKLLPKKAMAVAQQSQAPKEELVKPEVLEHKTVPQKTAAAPKAKPKKAGAPSDYLKKLAMLSKSFEAELDAPPEPSDETSDEDLSYFDQVYLLMKEAFSIPPHINRMAHMKLSATIRIHLHKSGNVAKVTLEKASGDEHFDKAVMDSVRRIHNFGRVPILLQDSVMSAGIDVQMCPFECVGS